MEGGASNLFGTLTENIIQRPHDFRKSAWTEHVPFAFWLIEYLQPKTYVELGTYHGMSFLAVCQAVCANRLDTKAYAVDLWLGDDHAGRIPSQVYKALGETVASKYGGFATLIRSDFAEASRKFEDGSVDLLHIDGLHTYEAVKADYECWKPKLSKSAVVLFHDTSDEGRGFGVNKFWGEVTEGRKCFNFLHGHGLGVLAVGNQYPAELDMLFNAGDRETELVRMVFGRLGAGIADMQRIEKIKNSLLFKMLLQARNQYRRAFRSF